MKKLYSLICILVLTTSYGYSQSLTFSEDTVVVVGDSSQTLTAFVDVVNTAGTEMEIKVYREVTEFLFGSQNNMCWGAHCYPPPTDESPNSVMIPSQAIDTTFKGILSPYDNVGICTIKYCFYDVANPSDESCVVVRFESQGAAIGISELDNTSTISTPNPNPASNFTLLKYNIAKTAANAQLEIVNLTGMLVHQQNLNTKAKAALVSVEGLENGLYLYSFIVDGRTVATQRLLVSH